MTVRLRSRSRSRSSQSGRSVVRGTARAAGASALGRATAVRSVSDGLSRSRSWVVLLTLLAAPSSGRTRAVAVDPVAVLRRTSVRGATVPTSGDGRTVVSVCGELLRTRARGAASVAELSVRGTVWSRGAAADDVGRLGSRRGAAADDVGRLCSRRGAAADDVGRLGSRRGAAAEGVEPPDSRRDVTGGGVDRLGSRRALGAGAGAGRGADSGALARGTARVVGADAAPPSARGLRARPRSCADAADAASIVIIRIERSARIPSC